MNGGLINTFGTFGGPGGGGAPGPLSVAADAAFATAGTTTFTTANQFQRVSIAVGSGAYTRKLALSRTGRRNGDAMTFLATIDAGSEATLQVFDDTVSGAQLFGYTAAASADGVGRLDFIYTGTAWIAAAPNQVFETAAEAPPPEGPVPLMFFEADSLALNNNDPVSGWNSTAPATLNADQATSGSRPVYRINQVNSHPIVRFDGADDFMNLASTANLTDFSLIVVAKVSAATTQTVLGGSNTSQAFTFGAAGIDPTTGDPDAGVTASIYTYKAGDASAPTSADIGNPSAAFALYEINRSAGVVTCKKNGVTVAGYAEDGDGGEIPIDRIGKTGLFNLLNGDIALIKVWSSVLSGGDMTTQRGTIAAKYGITLP